MTTTSEPAVPGGRSRRSLLARFLRREEGVAATEFALILPAMATLLLGVIDVGNAMTVARRSVIAATTLADQITRYSIMSNTELEDAVDAVALIMAPYEEDELGYDILSIEFDSRGNADVLWRVTHGMTPNGDYPNALDGAGTAGMGLVVVTTEVSYDPRFWGFATGEFVMRDTAIMVGRRSQTVEWDSDAAF